jgi:GTP-binding protein
MSHPLAAIVGRPNVGKSTLFNRIVGARDAIVHDLPGVTRDRHYADTEWAGKPFTIVDTGGFVPLSDDTIETAIREQAQIAIDEADMVLFVVDGKAGRSPADVEIASILRRSRKRVLLIVNKIDSDRAEGGTGDFFSLGLGEPISVSALAGRKIGDLLDLLTAEIHVAEEQPQDPRLKIAVIGKPNVGKSSFVNALLQKERHIVTDIPGTTRDPIDAPLRYQGEDLLLIDTAGLRRKSRIKESIEFFSTVRTLKTIDRCDVAAILLDATQGLEHQDLRIVEAAMDRKRGTVLVVNKWDLIEKDDKTARAYEQALHHRLRMYSFLPVVFVSSLTRQRIYKVIDSLQQVDAEQNKRIPTSTLNAVLGADLKAVPPQSKSGKEIKVKYVAQVGVKPPLFAFYCNEPKLIDESYRRYLENRLRKHFTYTGVPLSVTFRQK